MSSIILSRTNQTNHYTEMMNELSTSPPIQSFEEYASYPAYNTFQTMGLVPNNTTDYQYQRPNSPESIASLSSPSTPPTANTQNNSQLLMDMTSANPSTTARVKEIITRANSVPMEFYHTEFLEYSKETYEKKLESRNKRKRSPQHDYASNKRKKIDMFSDEDFEDEEYSELVTTNNEVSSAEIRRQIHIQSEQKRRAQIKDGFDELRKHLPGCNNKKMSKAALLTRTVQQLQHLKGVQNELLSEVERLLQENEMLKKFQNGVLQRQAMEKMYTF